MTDILDKVVIRKTKRGGRGMRMTVKQDGTITLFLPRFVSVAAGRKYLASKKDWILEAKKRLEGLPVPFLHQGSRKEYLQYRKVARQCITERLEYFGKIYSLSYQKLTIRNQTTRFGSCSSRGNLSFTYQLLFLPERLRDYVIVHELCHLKELNHSRKFWALVAQTIPDYRERKHELQAFSREQS